MLLKKGDYVGLISCSDGMSKTNSNGLLEAIIEKLGTFGIKVKCAETIFRVNGPFSGTPQERASELNRLFSDGEIKAIFDVSGGDSANQVLDYLDYELIKNNPKPFAGMSDLSVILNGINKVTGIPTYHYCIRNLANEDEVRQIEYFKKSFLGNDTDVYDIEFQWVCGTEMNGVVVGGNIRCFLKLAGTKYIPNPEGKILFLESWGGGPNAMASLLTQLKQIGYLDKLAGILLGTFSMMEDKNLEPDIGSLVLDITNDLQIPVAKTSQLGHNADAKCIIIGKELKLT